MAKYNTKKIYNKRYIDGGANYNSGPYVIVIYDTGQGYDTIENIIANIDISEYASVNDSVSLVPIIISLSDVASTADIISVSANVDINEQGLTNDLISINANANISDAGIGIDFISVADTFFIIDEDNILQPLGVLVTRDSKYDMLPSINDKTEEIPGKHGEFYFGKDFKSKAFELNVVTDDGKSELEKLQLQRLFAKYLDTSKGAKKLIFSNDINKTYLVKYVGKISFSEYASWFPFVIPFKMSNPFIVSSFEKLLVGSGLAVNEGNVETPLIIKILGPVTNPSLQIGAYTLFYNGTIPLDNEVIVDTHMSTAMLNNEENVLDKISGELPYYLPVGNNTVTADSHIILLWQSRWI